MRLVRVATLYFQTLPTEWKSWVMRFGPVSVKTLALGKQTPTNGKVRMLVFAEIALKELPSVAQDGLIDVPEAERRLCELAIETVANIISVSIRSSRSILSLAGCGAQTPAAVSIRSSRSILSLSALK